MPKRMFPFVTHLPNPIGGCASGNSWGDDGFKLCSFDCCYCWAKDLKIRFKYPKYQGPWRLYPREMRQYGLDDFPWPCDMIDIGDPTIPNHILEKLFKWIGEQPCSVLVLTKNPMWYLYHTKLIPPNAVLGATIETDRYILKKVSKAPPTFHRLDAMEWLSLRLINKLFISVEPVMRFSQKFADEIIVKKPWAVAVGYDNYGNQLSEPYMSETEFLIGQLEDAGITIYRKTIRERWDA